MLQTGALFARDYEIIRLLGAGGMGSVYEAKQLSTGRRRALKVMKPELVVDDALRARFAQEAKVSARVQSEHVVDVVAAGIEDDTPWLAMELLEGEDLGARLDREGALSFDATRAILEQVGRALAVAHAAKVVHRDLKPENVFLVGAPPKVKLLDFGIAKVIANTTIATVRNTEALGSPIWMAPEQTELGMVSPAADLWSLGLLTFTMLTGKVFWRSFATPNVHRILKEVILDPIPAASARAAELGVPGLLPPWFDAWFARCVQRMPTSRFATATDALAAFAPPPAPTVTIARKRSALPFVAVGLVTVAVAVGTYSSIPRLTHAGTTPVSSATTSASSQATSADVDANRPSFKDVSVPKSKPQDPRARSADPLPHPTSSADDDSKGETLWTYPGDIDGKPRPPQNKRTHMDAFQRLRNDSAGPPK